MSVCFENDHEMSLLVSDPLPTERQPQGNQIADGGDFMKFHHNCHSVFSSVIHHILVVNMSVWISEDGLTAHLRLPGLSFNDFDRTGEYVGCIRYKHLP